MSNQEIPTKQRALILQGSVALGAFEAGVFKKLYEIIKKEDPNWESRMFDIVAGTSAGAVNAAILTSHVKEKKHGRVQLKNSRSTGESTYLPIRP